MGHEDLTSIVQFSPERLRHAIDACTAKAGELERERQRYLLLAQTYRQLLTLHEEQNGNAEPGAFATPVPPRGNVVLRFLWILERINSSPTGIPARELSEALGMQHPKGLGGFAASVASVALKGAFTLEEVVRKENSSRGVLWGRGPRIAEAIEHLRAGRNR